MSTEKMREEFELWWYDHKQKELRQSCAIGWGLVIWQASRAAIEVGLPAPEFADGISQHRMLDVKDTIKAIESLGLKVKP